MANPKHLTNPLKIPSIAKVGQPLPGMVPSISLPEIDQPHERGERLIGMRKKVKNPTLRSIIEAPNPSVMEEEKIDRERFLATQRSWDGDTRPHTPVLPNRLPDCKRDVWTWRTLKGGKEDKEDDEDLMEWWRSVQPWGAPPSDHQLSQETARKAYTEKAQRVKKALLLYDYLLSDRGNALYDLITALIDVAKNLDKVYKRAKIAGITGGTAGAAGVAAAVGGVLLAPLTMGASLAVAAVGVGVATAGGITGASAAITNKVHNNMDRKRVEKIFSDYTTKMEDIESCVQFISTGMEHLLRHKLQGVERELEKVPGVDPVVWVNAGTISAINKSSGLIQGFALGIDMYFTKDDTQKLKKGSETKFAKQIREVAHQMETTLNELMKVKDKLASAKKKNII
ncbi:apolipoprotein L6-like [Pygocentrus nattereri]|uniref:apolipoprotein L6-like n=1 Tax=Pygocentrus nattereri TaxID=42514 RepID=UPI0008146A6A|nr:apolipoprotein L6-like [Pygocentrus nattereri]